MGFYWKWPFSPYRFIKNGLYRSLSKQPFSLYCLIALSKTALAFFCKCFFLFIALSKTTLAFVSLYWKWSFSFIALSKTALAFISLFKNSLFRFIKNSLYRGFFALSKAVFIGLYQKWLFCFIALSKTVFYWPLSETTFFTISIYQKRPLSAFISLYRKRALLVYHFIINGLYRGFITLLKTAFIEDFCCTKNDLYQP